MLKQLFGIGKTVINWTGLMNNGAVIVDVRSQQEYASGHIKGSLNIPLPVLSEKINQLNKEKTVITCCASGMRSAAAKKILQSKGFTTVHNGGGWYSLQQKIKA